MNILADYSPSELVRLELLKYPTPEGLHPIESSWRNLAKKLLEHVEFLQDTMDEHHNDSSYKECYKCKGIKWKRYNFPKAFTPEN